MKKFLAVILAVAMMLSCVAAFAEEQAPQATAQTVYAQLSIDREVAKTVMTSFGMPEEQFAEIDPILAVVSALGLKVVSEGGAVQADLDLQGTNILSLAGALTENGLVIGSSLFPSYLFSMSTEEMTGMLQQFMPAAAAGGEGTAGGMDMAALGESFGKYIGEFVQVFQTAVVPGEAELGTYEFEGYTFDVRSPMNVDAKALTDALKKMVADMLNDPAIQGALQSVPNFNAEEILKGMDETLSEEHIPEVKVDVYGNSDGTGAIYTVSEATYKEKETPSFRYTMLSKGEEGVVYTMEMADQGITVKANMTAAGFQMEATIPGMWFMLDFKTAEAGRTVVDVYVIEKEKPLLTLTFAVSAEGGRTLSLNPEEKQAVTMADIQGMNEQPGDAVMGFMQEMMISLYSLPQTAGEAMPEAGTLVMKLMNPQAGQTSGQEAAPAETAPVEADPSAWKTVEDVLVLETESKEYGILYGENVYEIMFPYGGSLWQVKADLTEDQIAELDSIDIFDENREEKVLAIVNPLEISSVAELNKMAIPQEELDQLIGKTGQELLDAGWEQDFWGYGDNGRIYMRMINGKFGYAVYFNEEIVIPENYEDPIDITGFTVSGIEFNGPSWHFYETEEAPAE